MAGDLWWGERPREPAPAGRLSLSGITNVAGSNGKSGQRAAWLAGTLSPPWASPAGLPQLARPTSLSPGAQVEDFSNPLSC